MRLIPTPNNRLHFARVILFALICTLLYHVLAERKATVELDVRTTESTIFKMYWLNEPGAPWSEDNSRWVRLRPGNSRYVFKLTDLADIAVFRIDPSETPALVTIRAVTITQNGYAPIRIAGDEALARITPGDGIADMRLTGEGLEVTPAGIDPQLFFDLSGSRHKIAFWGGEFSALGTVFLAALLLGTALSRFIAEGNAATPLCLAAALALIVAMASISKSSAHPDEGAHIRAGDYYRDHILPPQVGDDRIRDTYSVYGVSRLHSGEIAYFFLGKFARLFHALALPSYMAQRYFNVTLWAVLLALAFACSEFRPLTAPLLISPQIWYIFSYANSEAFAVFVMILAAYQVAAKQSTWNRLLDAGVDPARPGRFALLWLGLLFGLLLLVKKNFYFFLLFLGLYFIWRVIFGHTRLTRPNVRRIAAVLLIGFGLFAGVRGTDACVNGFHKGAKMLEARYRFAGEMWNPGTPLEKRSVYLQMRDRGVTLQRLWTADQWGSKSFASAFGLYGAMSVKASVTYYRLVQCLGLLLLLAVTACVAAHGGWEGVSLWLLVLAGAGGLIAASLYQSWTVDFQPQGRYFLPIVGMLSVFCLECRNSLFRIVVPPLCAGLFLLSLYSFVCVALPGIPK